MTVARVLLLFLLVADGRALAVGKSRYRAAPKMPLYEDPRVAEGYFFPQKSGVFQALREPHEVVKLAGQGGAPVYGYWVHSLKNAPTLLYLYGNGGAAETEHKLWSQLSKLAGVNLFVLDYPGYGESKGRSTFTSCAQAAGEALAMLLARKDVPAVYVLGRSAGSIFALDAAAKHSASPRFKGLILESGVADVVQRLRDRRDYASLGVDQEPMLKEVARDFDHRSKIGAVRAPILVLHTQGDTVVPSWQGRQLAAWAGAKLAQHLEFERGNHGDILEANWERYVGALQKLMTDARAEPSPLQVARWTRP